MSRYRDVDFNRVIALKVEMFSLSTRQDKFNRQT